MQKGINEGDFTVTEWKEGYEETKESKGGFFDSHAYVVELDNAESQFYNVGVEEKEDLESTEDWWERMDTEDTVVEGEESDFVEPNELEGAEMYDEYLEDDFDDWEEDMFYGINVPPNWHKEPNWTPNVACDPKYRDEWLEHGMPAEEVYEKLDGAILEVEEILEFIKIIRCTMTDLEDTECFKELSQQAVYTNFLEEHVGYLREIFDTQYANLLDLGCRQVLVNCDKEV
jgi:hypothetical protein